jgi:hypothetical protein
LPRARRRREASRGGIDDHQPVAPHDIVGGVAVEFGAMRIDQQRQAEPAKVEQRRRAFRHRRRQGPDAVERAAHQPLALGTRAAAIAAKDRRGDGAGRPLDVTDDSAHDPAAAGQQLGRERSGCDGGSGHEQRERQASGH